MGLSASTEQDVHWVDDRERPACVGCGVAFGVVRRRHHCRECGEVYCAECCVKPSVTMLDPSYQALATARTRTTASSFNSAASVASTAPPMTKRRCNRCLNYVSQQARGGLSPFMLPKGDPIVPHLNLPKLIESPPEDGDFYNRPPPSALTVSHTARTTHHSTHLTSSPETSAGASSARTKSASFGRSLDAASDLHDALASPLPAQQAHVRR
eukprot:TRINITY_DN3669_c1_g1_i1.p2 TRINITY_DN3669_c1_g1~~TRINITY_DN3669_c1_g1_i1.p2  ORF type:complete len:227 (+),score=75.11 TRINITY_DN3669_c1_g1_i1:46-681(+)